jgi:hypothetical protein
MNSDCYRQLDNARANETPVKLRGATGYGQFSHAVVVGALLRLTIVQPPIVWPYVRGRGKGSIHNHKQTNKQTNKQMALSQLNAPAQPFALDLSVPLNQDSSFGRHAGRPSSGGHAYLILLAMNPHLATLSRLKRVLADDRCRCQSSFVMVSYMLD